MKNKSEGFTLIELVIALVIVGVLVAVAVPYYKNKVMETRRTDGKAILLEIMAAEERFFTINNTYTTNLVAGGLGMTDAGAGSVASESGYYLVSAAACGTGIGACVILTATAQGVQVSDGNLTLNSLGNKTPTSAW
ncbi:MAG: type IV pilin protein [Magnetococcales bacterium]|nr:type IV pilin protein [Magnetococcales bacterium]